MSLNRRDFIRCFGTATAFAAMAPRLVFSAEGSSSRGTLVVIFQRGGMDGLHAIVPHGDADYYRLRPSIGIGRPGVDGGAIDLDGFFGLHPALAPLLPLYQSGELAIVHATGLQHDNRSHFQCQDYIERGSLELTQVSSGWLNRHLATIGGDATFQAVGYGNAVQPSLRGIAPVIGMSEIAAFNLTTTSMQAAALKVTIADLHRSSSLLDVISIQALGAIDELLAANPSQYAVEGGAVYPNGSFGNGLREVAQLIKANIGLEIACVDIGGWDHHDGINQELPGLLTELAEGLVAFRTDLGARMADVTVLTLTEFGRRAKENASAGTDHGSAFASFVLGAGVNGGRVYSEWPGLRDADLDDGDLKVTIDYRTWLSELLSKRLGNDDIASVFPNFVPGPSLELFRTRG